MRNLDEFLNLDEFEPVARRKMEPGAFDYYAGGAADEHTMRENQAAFSRRQLRPSIFVDVSNIDTATTFLGSDVALPVGLAPAAVHKLAHPDGELASARAARDAGVLMCLSTLSNYSIEEVAAASDAPKWFQLYVHSDHDIAVDLVKRAEAAGYRTIVVTADLPVPGYRERELRSGFILPDDAQPGNYSGYAADEELMEVIDRLVDAGLTWDDLEWIAGASSLPIVVKGILTGEDARLAVEHGAAGVVVSNHGGRQLDRTAPAVDALEEVVQAVGGRAEVYLDGGVRRGTDVVVALALGARGVFIGRPYLYGLAAAGQAGVGRVLELIGAEITTAMGLLGTPRLEAIERRFVAP
ncbi:MAG: alpha-hydroxy acid oxidase [Actinomycetota bacterium]